MRVNLKVPGDCFGEVSLLYTTPRSATVAATLDSAVWVLERDTFRFASQSQVDVLPVSQRDGDVPSRNGSLFFL